MVYALNKYRHYLLDNKFVFYVDHMVLVHLLNKPHVSSHIAQWLLLFLEYDFTVVHKPGKSHGMANALFWLPNGEPTTGIQDQPTDAGLYYVLPEWLQDIVTYLKIEAAPLSISKDEQYKLILKALPYALKKGVLHKRGQDMVLRCLLDPSQAEIVMRELRCETIGGHFSHEIISQKILNAGYWWLAMHKDMSKYCRSYDWC